MLKRRSLLELVEAKPLVERKGNEVVPAGAHFEHSKSPTGIATSLENALVAIKQLGVQCSYDVFHDKIHVTNLGDVATSESFEGFEQIALLLRRKVLLTWGFDPGQQHMEHALRLECLDNTFDPIREYLDGLEWDGVPRIDRWLTRYCYADDTALHRAMGRKWLLGGVRRVRRPGCKFDEALIFEGWQGQGKSTAFKILAGGDENFSDAPIIGCDKREQQEAMQGVWIYEIAELEGMTKHDVTSIKLFLSTTHDRARPAFGRARVDRARRGVIGGTTNERSYLRDTTGNRRAWPIDLSTKPMIDLEALKRDRDQLWAEAAFYEAQGEALTLPPELWGAASEAQQLRLTHDPWQDTIESHLSGLRENKARDGEFCVGVDDNGDRQWRVASGYLLGPMVLGIPVERQTPTTTRHLADVMRALGWAKPPVVIRVGTKSCRAYTKRIDEAPVVEKRNEAVAAPNVVAIKRRPPWLRGF
jgi:hypothetical protein